MYSYGCMTDEKSINTAKNMCDLSNIPTSLSAFEMIPDAAMIPRIGR